MDWNVASRWTEWQRIGDERLDKVVGRSGYATQFGQECGKWSGRRGRGLEMVSLVSEVKDTGGLKRRGQCHMAGMSREERHAEIGEAASMEMEMGSSNELTSSLTVSSWKRKEVLGVQVASSPL